MRHRLLTIYLLLLTALLAQGVSGSTRWQNAVPVTTEGTEFWLTFMCNYGKHVQDEDLSLSIYATANTTTDVTVTGTWTDPVTHVSQPYSRTFLVHAGEVDTLWIPNEIAYLQESNQTTNVEWLNKGIKVTSTAPISLYSHNANVNSYDASLILPTEGLNREYVIQTYTEDMQSTEFAIVSTRDNNAIALTLRRTLNGVTEVSTMDFVLNEGQSYCYRPTDRTISLAGTSICATEPIAVFQGGQHAKIPKNSDPASHIYHQVYSTDYWGKTYFVTRTSDNANDIVRITTATDGTQIYRGGTLRRTINAYETYEDVINWSAGEQAVVYTTSAPVECFLYATKRNSDFGSPALTPIVPVEQGVRSMRFATFRETHINELGMPYDAQETLDAYYKHYVNVVIPSSLAASVQLDGESVGSQFTPVSGTPYSAAIISVSAGSHLLTGSGTFTSRVYGLYKYDGDDYNYEQTLSYAYSGSSSCVHAAEVSVDGTRAGEKQMCINHWVNLNSSIDFEYDQPVLWEIRRQRDNSLVEQQETVHLQHYEFADTGRYVVSMIVSRQTPVCDYTISDTVQTTIVVCDTFLMQPTLENGNYRIVCEKERSSEIVAGATYRYRTDTMQLGSTHHYIDSLVSSAGCDSITLITVTVAPNYEYHVYDTICEQDMPYTYVDKQTGIASTGKLRNLTDPHGYQPYEYIDTLPTAGYHCDSIIHLHLLVNQDYRIDTVQSICVNEDFYWKGRHYVGEDYPNKKPTDIVCPIGLTYDSIYYPTSTTYACDSIHLLHLSVHANYRIPLYASTCLHTEPELPAFNISKFDNYTYDKVGHYTFTDSLISSGGCDSIVTLTLDVFPIYDRVVYDTICQFDPLYNWAGHSSHTVKDVVRGDSVRADSIPTDVYGDYEFVDNPRTVHGCDSIWTLRLHIRQGYQFYTSRDICDNDTFEWHGYIYAGDRYPEALSPRARHGVGTYHDTLVYTTYEGCDSIYYLEFAIHPYTDIVDTIDLCENEELTYLRQHFAGLPVGEHHFDTLLVSAYGCDSSVSLTIYVHPVYEYAEQDTMCSNDVLIWRGQTITNLPAGRHTCWDSLSTAITGCDSVYRLDLLVKPVYLTYDTLTLCDNDTLSWHGALYVGSRFEDFGGTYDAADYDSVRAMLDAGTYRSERYHSTAQLCDSNYYLTLIVSPTYYTEQERELCQDSEGYYEIMHNGAGGYVPTAVAGDIVYYDTVRTVHGCDSVVRMTYHILPEYRFHQDTTLCQDTLLDNWVWTDAWGIIHDVPISLARAGDTTYTDALYTARGCDSVYDITVHVLPIYRFDSVYVICQNERFSWQGRGYAGDSAGIMAGDRVLPPGTYCDTVRYATIGGCDSTYTMQVSIHPVYDTTTVVSLCDHDTYIRRLTDPFGTYIDTIWQPQTDTVRLDAEDAHLPQALKAAIRIIRDTVLRTVNECDSVSRLRLTVHPSYYFVSDTAICSSESIRWRGKRYMANDTVVYDRYTTAEGCDSVYELRLHLLPTYMYLLFREICDNETVYHNGSHVMWQPGQPIPEVGDCNGLYFQTHRGCDSIYCYFITVHPSYAFDDTVALHSGETYLFHNTSTVALTYLFDVGRYVQPIDTFFRDDYTTVYGCDSTYTCHATIYPEYRHVDSVVICDDACYDWRGRTYCGSTAADGEALGAGTYIFYDSLLTDHGCDSVYVLSLTIHPTYYSEQRDTICDDDTYLFGDRTIAAEPGEHVYTDTLSSIHGCDSVSRLYLTVLPVTTVVIHDTICTGDTYHLHGVPLTQSGFYADTARNTLGCRYITQLHLQVEEPPVMQIEVEDFCSDSRFIHLRYTSDGRLPLTYTVLFDSAAHSQGFRDVTQQPVAAGQRISLPVPYGELLPSAKNLADTLYRAFPRPGTYGLSLYLNNGVCDETSIRIDTVFEILFPSWIHEQHWNDAILLLNEQYNGGYVFDDYQWYCDGQPIAGEVQAYLYDPQMLQFGREYYADLHVASFRGEPVDEWHYTCPIVPRVLQDTIVPSDTYVAVVPTCLPPGLDGVDILCTEVGTHTYQVADITGRLLLSGEFSIDSSLRPYHLSLPHLTQGVVRILTQSGMNRSVIVVRDCDLK